MSWEHAFIEMLTTAHKNHLERRQGLGLSSRATRTMEEVDHAIQDPRLPGRRDGRAVGNDPGLGGRDTVLGIEDLGGGSHV